MEKKKIRIWADWKTGGFMDVEVKTISLKPLFIWRKRPLRYTCMISTTIFA